MRNTVSQRTYEGWLINTLDRNFHMWTHMNAAIKCKRRFRFKYMLNLLRNYIFYMENNNVSVLDTFSPSSGFVAFFTLYNTNTLQLINHKHRSIQSWGNFNAVIDKIQTSLIKSFCFLKMSSAHCCKSTAKHVLKNSSGCTKKAMTIQTSHSSKGSWYSITMLSMLKILADSW